MCAGCNEVPNVWQMVCPTSFDDIKADTYVHVWVKGMVFNQRQYGANCVRSTLAK